MSRRSLATRRQAVVAAASCLSLALAGCAGETTTPDPVEPP